MNRRRFLHLSVLSVAASSFGVGSLFAEDEDYASWRTYEITTHVEVTPRSSLTKLWLPMPVRNASFQQVLSGSVHADGGKTTMHENRSTQLQILTAEFPAGRPAVLTTVQRMRTRDWKVNPDARRGHSTAPAAAQEAFLKPTRYVPTDGIVKSTSDEITKGAVTDVEKTKAIYDWVVKNTYRDPKVRGCGVGNIKPMLETGDLGGKCADLNGLFVGLVKASGVPARDAYGIRIGPSALECKSLGASSEHIEKSQHCRAEVFLQGYGWAPMDPADVRKAIIEESAEPLPLTNPKIANLQQRLFGSWEMNWVAFNYAQDVTLPGLKGTVVPFLMYPQAETDEGRLDSLDAANFKYQITSRSIT